MSELNDVIALFSRLGTLEMTGCDSRPSVTIESAEGNLHLEYFAPLEGLKGDTGWVAARICRAERKGV